MAQNESEIVRQEQEEMIMELPSTEGEIKSLISELEASSRHAEQLTKVVYNLLVKCTYPKDWVAFPNGVVELSSAGAERLAKHFSISMSDVKWEKREFEDEIGKGYEYIYTGYACWKGRKIFVQGIYSTREKLLGYTKKDGWKTIEQIKESDIQTAAYRRFVSNAIRSLLGLRRMPLEVFENMGWKVKPVPIRADEITNSEQYRNGKKAKEQAVDEDKKEQIRKMCRKIAEAGYIPQMDAEGNWHLKPNAMGFYKDKSPEEMVDLIVETISAFVGKDGSLVHGKKLDELSGTWLNATYGKIKKAYEVLDKVKGDKE
ncbi:MAG: hypothetical protein DRN20_06660 [Thermoplasmata archaeon]|nr:MAG: hypothetical protein DRN20_06660 [Thermoplasmata archaeon]